MYSLLYQLLLAVPLSPVIASLWAVKLEASSSRNVHGGPGCSTSPYSPAWWEYTWRNTGPPHILFPLWYMAILTWWLFPTWVGWESGHLKATRRFCQGRCANELVRPSSFQSPPLSTHSGSQMGTWLEEGCACSASQAWLQDHILISEYYHKWGWFLNSFLV